MYPSSMLRRTLHAFGYVFAHVLFLGVDAPESVVRRLRFAYRLVSVEIEARNQYDPGIVDVPHTEEGDQ